MLSPQTVDKIKRLFKQGRLTDKQIAARVGVSRTTVANIMNGDYRPVYGFKHKLKQPEPKEVLIAVRETALKRCPGCGGKIYVEPCVYCLIKSI